MKAKFYKSIVCFLALAMLIFVLQSLTVFAEAPTAVVGDFTISPTDGNSLLTEGIDYSFDKDELIITTTTPVIIGMKDGVTTTNNTIRIWTTGGEADITFNNIDILTSSEFSAVQINGTVNGQKVTDDNPCIFHLIGINTIKNTYKFGHAIRSYGDNADLTITSDSSGVLNVSNTGSNGTIFAEHGADLTICGNANISATSEVQSALNNFGTTTISENAKATISAKRYGIVSGNKSTDDIVIKDNADVNITAVTVGIYAQNTVTVSDNAKIVINGDGTGTAGIRAENTIALSGYSDIEMNNTGAYGIRSYDASVSVSDNVKLLIDTVRGSGIYAETSLSLSGNAEVTVKNAEDFGAAGSDAGFQLSDNVKFTATNVGTGLYSSSDAAATTIGDSVQITVNGSCESGIKFNGEKGVEFSISGQPTIDVVSSGYGSGISFGKSTATVQGSPLITITCSGEICNGIYASSDGTLVIKGDTDITISGTAEYIINSDISVHENAVINATAITERGIDGNITVDENAKVTIDNATERGVYGDAYIGGNAEFIVKSSGEEGIYGNLTVCDNAKVLLLAVGSDRVLSKDPTVKPLEGKAYMIEAGESETETHKSYYTKETIVPSRSAWKYFYTESVDTIPVTITVNEENTVLTYSGDVDLTQLFNVDENAGIATYTVINNTGEGTQNGDKLTVTKSGTFTVKVSTAVNGIYLPGEAETTLTINKANHTIDENNIPKVSTVRSGKTLSASKITPSELKDNDGNVIGAFSWVTPDEKMSKSGKFVKQIKFTPTDTANYNEQFFDVTVTVYATAGLGTIPSGSASTTPSKNGDSSNTQPQEDNTTQTQDDTVVTTKTNENGEIIAEIITDDETNVVIPVENPDEITKVIITDKDGNKTETTDINIVDGGISISVSGNTSILLEKKVKKIFIDVHPVNHWATNDIDYTYINGLMMGVSDNMFAPDEPHTRAMLVTVLYRSECEPEVAGKATFLDIDENAYYSKAVVWAQQNGIVNGYSEKIFAPNDNITREQIAAIMHRYATFKEYDVSVGENTNILSYDDYAEISEYAISSMQYAVGGGILRGKTGSTINPQDNATRAECAAILHRFIEANK